MTVPLTCMNSLHQIIRTPPVGVLLKHFGIANLDVLPVVVELGNELLDCLKSRCRNP